MYAIRSYYADDHQVAVLRSEQLEKSELSAVRVLVLVDQEEREVIPISCQELRLTLQELDRLGQEVVEVESPGRAEDLV